MTRLRMLWRIITVAFQLLLAPRTWGRHRRALDYVLDSPDHVSKEQRAFAARGYERRNRWAAALALGLTLLAGCATTKPLSVACVSCALLQASGLCATAKTAAKAMPPCPQGGRLEILNYQRWIDGEEAPRVACRRYSIQ